MKKTCSAIIEEIIANQEQIVRPSDLSTLPFIDAIYPWIFIARKRLEEKAGTRLALLEKEAQAAQERFLLQRWSDMTTPSFYLELEIKKLQNNLQGATSQDRYLDFVKRSLLDKDVLRGFFNEYESLAERIAIALDLWVEETNKFLVHLEQDLPLLEKTFNEGKSLGKVASFHLNAGDVHQGGKAVRILHFTSGKKVVYKPKDLGIIKTFNEFLLEINQLGLSPSLKSYAVLPMEGYGWEEWIEHKPCDQLSQAEDYFQRAGMLLCLLFLLEGKDAHFENIIASGEFPVLIDLETLLHSSFPEFETKGVEEIFMHSVLTTGLLPSFESGKEKGRANDLSGLGSRGEENVFQSTVWKNVNTDEMHLEEESSNAPLSTSQVRCKDSSISADDYVDSIVAGFGKMYELLQQNRAFFLSWLEKLSEHPVRFVMRATRVYFLLLRRLHTPQVLLDKELQDKEIEILHRLWTDRGKAPITSILEEETKALMHGDIPSFHSFPNSKDFFSGEKLIQPNFFSTTSYEIVKKRIQEMNEKEKKQQQAYIRYAFQAKKREIHVQEKSASLTLSESNAYSEELVLQTATSLAAYLRNSAFIAEDGNLGWLSLHPNANTGFYAFRPLDDNLYSGKAGIALFFAALAHLTQDKKWEQEALTTLKGLRDFIQNAKDKNLPLLLGGLGMAGAGGTAYSLFHIGQLLSHEKLVQEALELIEQTTEQEIKKDTTYDIIGGSAGYILVLLSLYNKTKKKKLLDLATLCAHHLCDSALDRGEGAVAWNSPSGDPYIGFAHGTAGIGYALLKLHEIAPNPEFLRIAKAAQTFERRSFSQKEKNWPVTSQREEYWASWCHGAVGIGLSRLFTPSQDHQDDFQCAMDANYKALEEGSSGLSLCCGLLGRLEFLLEARQLKPNAKVEETLQKTISSLLHHLNGKKNPTLSPTDEWDDPGFMKGTAGIGYTLLRVIDKEKKLPQVLLFS